MIAPIRSTEHARDEQAKLLARARRAIAQGLLFRVRSPAQPAITAWAAWTFVAGAVFMAASTLLTSWWQFRPY